MKLKYTLKSGVQIYGSNLPYNEAIAIICGFYDAAKTGCDFACKDVFNYLRGSEIACINIEDATEKDVEDGMDPRILAAIKEVKYGAETK